MATRKRTTSDSGAYMSQYDTEVKAALVKINARLDALEAHTHEAPVATGGGLSVEESNRIAGLEEDVRNLHTKLGV